MTQTRYTLQQHHVNLKSSVKLSHVNMYHCESPASNIFPGHPYSKIIFIQKGQGQFYFGNQFLPVRENDLLLMNPDKQKFSVDVRESPLDFIILGIENLSFIVLISSWHSNIIEFAIISDGANLAISSNNL